MSVIAPSVKFVFYNIFLLFVMAQIPVDKFAKLVTGAGSALLLFGSGAWLVNSSLYDGKILLYFHFILALFYYIIYIEL